MPSDPRPLIAALADDRRRLLLAEITVAADRGTPYVVERLSAAERRRLETLERAGLVAVEGELVRPVDAFSAALAPQPALSGLDRFVRDGRIRDWPRRPADRMRLMTWAADAVLAADEEVDEATLTSRLARVWRDAVTLRRDLVDARLVTRTADGSAYRRAATTA